MVVKVGDKYTLEIEDGGDLINILEEEKNRLQGTFYEIKYFQEDFVKATDQVIFYSRKLPDSNEKTLIPSIWCKRNKWNKLYFSF